MNRKHNKTMPRLTNIKKNDTMYIHHMYIRGGIMRQEVLAWGNSASIRLSKPILSLLDLKIGDEVDMIVKDDALIIRKPKLTLDSLFENYNGIYTPEDIDFGVPVGKEVF